MRYYGVKNLRAKKMSFEIIKPFFCRFTLKQRTRWIKNYILSYNLTNI